MVEETVLKADGKYQLFYERDDAWQNSKGYEMIEYTLKQEANKIKNKEAADELLKGEKRDHNLDRQQEEFINELKAEQKLASLNASGSRGIKVKAKIWAQTEKTLDDLYPSWPRTAELKEL